MPIRGLWGASNGCAAARWPRFCSAALLGWGLSGSQSTALASAGTPTTFTAYVGPGNPSGLTTTAAELGYHVTTASDYLDDSSWAGISDDQWDIKRWANTGYQMTWGVPMLPTIPGVSLAIGATGAYNSYFHSLALSLVAAGMGGSILRVGWEFNQASFPWYAAGQAGNFVNYWRQIVTTMRSVPGQAFQFEWNPSRGDDGGGDAAMGNFTSYYPGDAYVSVVGLDIYDDAWVSYPGASAEFQHIVSQTWGLDWLATFGASHGKALDLPEVGLGAGTSAPNSGPVSGMHELCGGDDPVFVTDVLSWAEVHQVENVAYWDDGVSSIEFGKNPETLGALQVALKALNGSAVSSSIPGAIESQDPTTATTTLNLSPNSPSATTPAPVTTNATGSSSGTPPTRVSPTGGYYEVASDGGIFAFNAPFQGSTGNIHLNSPIVGMAVDPATGGYYEVASDGGIFAFDAPFRVDRQHPSQLTHRRNGGRPGYRWVLRGGFGRRNLRLFNAPFQGSTGNIHLNSPIVGMAVDPATGGYYEVASDGGIFAFNAPFRGRPATSTSTHPSSEWRSTRLPVGITRWLRTAESSPSTPRSKGRPATSISTHPSSEWRSTRLPVGITRWLRTAESWPSTPRSKGRPATSTSTHPSSEWRNFRKVLAGQSLVEDFCC